MFNRDLPREFLLVAACCRWPLSDPAIAVIRGACAGPVDWRYFLGIVRRHRVVGLVQHALLKAQVEVPTEIALKLASAARENAERNMRLAVETARLQRTFDAAQIPVMVLKGAALAQLAFGSLALKHSKDIDLLVPPDRVEAAFRLLERDGYTLQQPAKHLDAAQWRAVICYGVELAAIHPVKRQQVELRWRLADNPLLIAGLATFSSTQDVPISNDASIRTFGDDSHFAYLCVHGAWHGWSRLKWLADFNALIANRTPDQIERLYAHALTVGNDLCVGLALLLCNRIFALNIPDRLKAKPQGNWRLKIAVAMAMDLMVGPDAEIEMEERRFGTTRVALMQFLLGHGWRYFFAQCRIASVRLGDVVSYPLPASLHFLYPLLRVPSWLWRRARGTVLPGVKRKNAG